MATPLRALSHAALYLAPGAAPDAVPDAEPRAIRARPSDQTRKTGAPILLLQGFASSGRVMLPLERRLRRDLSRPTLRVANLPVGPLHIQDIRKSARALNEALDGIAREHEADFIDVVGHSMGGLIAAYLLKRLDCGRRIRRVVTLGTPHLGAPAALAGVLAFGLVSRAIWQMVPRSSFLEDLYHRPVPQNSELLSIAARGDALVPASRSQLPAQPRQANVTTAATSHIELLLSSNVSNLVANALTSPGERQARNLRSPRRIDSGRSGRRPLSDPTAPRPFHTGVRSCPSFTA
jgi:triacylglycerol lipase